MSDLDLPLAVRMMQDGYLMEIQDLKEKNEQLRKERDFYFKQVTDNGERAHGAIDTLNAENEKLRELVRELYDELDAATQYDAGGGRGVVYEFADRMRELGIEADA